MKRLYEILGELRESTDVGIGDALGAAATILLAERIDVLTKAVETQGEDVKKAIADFKFPSEKPRFPRQY